MAIKSLFVSHGSPTILIEDNPWKKLLSNLGKRLSEEEKPEAVVVISPHFTSWNGEFLIEIQDPLPCIQDYYGFPQELYSYCYSTHNDTDLATSIIKAAKSRGLRARAHEKWGLDHGAWIPLLYMFPNGIKTVPISITEASPETHLEMGKAIADASRGRRILVIGTGSPTHRLDLMYLGARKISNKLDHTLASILEKGDLEALLQLRSTREWIEAQPEGLLRPLYIAIGAAETPKAKVFAMDSPWPGVSMFAAEFLDSSA
ncbi:MAG: dioxygenase [Thermocladium sp.]